MRSQYYYANPEMTDIHGPFFSKDLVVLAHSGVLRRRAGNRLSGQWSEWNQKSRASQNNPGKRKTRERKATAVNRTHLSTVAHCRQIGKITQDNGLQEARCRRDRDVGG